MPQTTLIFFILVFSSVQFSHSACSTLCDPIDCSTAGLPVHHQLPEFIQTHVHCVSDAIQASHPLLSPSSPTFNLSQQQGLFQMSQFFASGGQGIGVSASASVLPMNIQYWFTLGWTGWISFLSKGLSRIFSNTTVQKHQFFGAQLSFQLNSHPYMTTGKTIALIRWTFVGKIMSLLFNMLSRLVITFLPRSKRLLIFIVISHSVYIGKCDFQQKTQEERLFYY